MDSSKAIFYEICLPQCKVAAAGSNYKGSVQKGCFNISANLTF